MSISHRPAALALALLTLIAGCAHASDGKPAVCDGRHRRSANPFGSVLPIGPETAAAPAASSPSTASPLGAPDLRSFRPCGRRP